jgi:hypothetical protein
VATVRAAVGGQDIAALVLDDDVPFELGAISVQEISNPSHFERPVGILDADPSGLQCSRSSLDTGDR